MTTFDMTGESPYEPRIIRYTDRPNSPCIGYRPAMNDAMSRGHALWKAVQAASAGDTISLPPGDHTLNRTRTGNVLSLALPPGVRLRGMGAGVTTITLYEPRDGENPLKASDANLLRGFTVRIVRAGGGGDGTETIPGVGAAIVQDVPADQSWSLRAHDVEAITDGHGWVMRGEGGHEWDVTGCRDRSKLGPEVDGQTQFEAR